MKDEHLILFLFGVLHAAGELGCTEAFLLQRAKIEAWPRLTLPDLQAQLQTLANDSWVLSWKPKLADYRWKILDAGVNVLRERNQA